MLEKPGVLEVYVFSTRTSSLCTLQISLNQLKGQLIGANLLNSLNAERQTEGHEQGCPANAAGTRLVPPDAITRCHKGCIALHGMQSILLLAAPFGTGSDIFSLSSHPSPTEISWIRGRRFLLDIELHGGGTLQGVDVYMRKHETCAPPLLRRPKIVET